MADRRYYESTGRLPSASALAATIAHRLPTPTSPGRPTPILSGWCCASGSSIFVDLGDPTWRAIEIRPTGWQIVAKPDVHFRAQRASVRRPCRRATARLHSCKNLSTSSPPSCRS